MTDIRWQLHTLDNYEAPEYDGETVFITPKFSNEEIGYGDNTFEVISELQVKSNADIEYSISDKTGVMCGDSECVHNPDPNTLDYDNLAHWYFRYRYPREWYMYWTAPEDTGDLVYVAAIYPYKETSYTRTQNKLD